MTERSGHAQQPALVVVFDSNVLVPLILPNSFSQKLLTLIHGSGGEVAASPQILAEVARVLRTKNTLGTWLSIGDARVDEFLTTLPSLLRLTRGVRRGHGVVSKDPDDDKILAAARESGAHFIVTRDYHLLDLKNWKGVTIVTPQELYAHLERRAAA